MLFKDFLQCKKFFKPYNSNVIENNKSNRSNRLWSNSNRLNILKSNSNSNRLQSNSNRWAPRSNPKKKIPSP